MKLEDMIGCLVVASKPGQVALWNGDETLFAVDGLGLVVASYRPLALRSDRVGRPARAEVAKLAAQRWLDRGCREHAEAAEEAI
jgi:hypothetical protein